MSRSDVLLERISELWVCYELTERDIRSSEVTGPFRKICTCLCAAMCQHIHCLPADSSGKVKGAVNQILHFASSERFSTKTGQLDHALRALDRALDPASTAKSRMDVLERLVAAVQALRLLSISAQSNAAGQVITHVQDKSGDMQTPVLPGATEVSQQLCHIACLLEVDVGGDLAQPLLSAVNERLPELLQALPECFFSPLLPGGCLSSDQMEAMNEIDSDLRQEYRVRRQMLIERAKVLMQSFMRAERLSEEGLAQEAKSLADTFAASLKLEPEVSLSAAFTTRQADLVALSSKPSSGDKSKFVASVKQLNIGAVPNRGGIPSNRLGRHGQPGITAPGRDFHKKCRLK